MLEVILDENELSHDIPRKFEKGIRNWSCLFQLLVVDAAAVGDKAGLW